MLIINPNLRLEYKEIDEDNYEKLNEVMCECGLCSFMKIYIVPILDFCYFDLKIKKIKYFI